MLQSVYKRNIKLLLRLSLRPRQNRRHFDGISNAFSWMKMFRFKSKIYLRLFPRVQSTMFKHLSDNGLAPTRRQAINLNQWWLNYWCIYASLGLSVLKHACIGTSAAHGYANRYNGTVYIYQIAEKIVKLPGKFLWNFVKEDTVFCIVWSCYASSSTAVSIQVTEPS